jgi:hypothetical protein
LLVPAGDTKALAAAIRRLVNDAGERRRLGSAARATFTDRFTIQSCAERVAAHQSRLRRVRDVPYGEITLERPVSLDLPDDERCRLVLTTSEGAVVCVRVDGASVVHRIPAPGRRIPVPPGTSAVVLELRRGDAVLIGVTARSEVP